VKNVTNIHGKRRRPTLLALPDGVKWEDQLWEPTWEERAIDWHRQQAALALAEPICKRHPSLRSPEMEG
jgi:hypothetical protein